MSFVREQEVHIELKDRITPELKEQTALIESLGLGSYKKAELALLLAGVVQATEINVSKWDDDPATIQQVLEQCGLFVVGESNEQFPESLKGVLYVGKDRATVEQFVSLDSRVDDEAYGRMMGYPETAVKAFGNEAEMLSEEEQLSLPPFIIPFRCSKSGLQQELRTAME